MSNETLIERVEFTEHKRLARVCSIAVPGLLGVGGAVALGGHLAGSRGVFNAGVLIACCAAFFVLAGFIALVGLRFSMTAIDVLEGGLRVQFPRRTDFVPWHAITGVDSTKQGPVIARMRFWYVRVREGKTIQLSETHQGRAAVERVLDHVFQRTPFRPLFSMR